MSYLVVLPCLIFMKKVQVKEIDNYHVQVQVLYIFYCLMPDDFTHPGRASGWEWVNYADLFG